MLLGVTVVVVLTPYYLCAQCITPGGKTIASVHESCSENLNNAEWQLSTKIVLRRSPEMMCIRGSSYLFIHHYSVSFGQSARSTILRKRINKCNEFKRYYGEVEDKLHPLTKRGEDVKFLFLFFFFFFMYLDTTEFIQYRYLMSCYSCNKMS